MKQTILQKAGEIFLKYGFKSITMDDIASELAISKKTIYKFFKNKQELVKETVSLVHETMHKEIFCICDKGYNAIEENFEIKNMFKNMFKNSDDSPMFQLEKYYPDIYHKMMVNEFDMFKDCILTNIKKGIKEGLYRASIDENLITKFYFSLAMSVHNSNLHTYNKNTLNKLETSVLEYHTRAIATLKGLKILEKQLEKNKI